MYGLWRCFCADSWNAPCLRRRFNSAPGWCLSTDSALLPSTSPGGFFTMASDCSFPRSLLQRKCSLILFWQLTSSTKSSHCVHLLTRVAIAQGPCATPGSHSNPLCKGSLKDIPVRCNPLCWWEHGYPWVSGINCANRSQRFTLLRHQGSHVKH